jgi:hypothetical protein
MHQARAVSHKSRAQIKTVGRGVLGEPVLSVIDAALSPSPECVPKHCCENRKNHLALPGQIFVISYQYYVDI